MDVEEFWPRVEENRTGQHALRIPRNFQLACVIEQMVVLVFVVLTPMKKSSGTRKELSAAEREKLLGLLQTRFEKNPSRHKGLQWAVVKARLDAAPDKLWSLGEMERTGGEPDVVGQDEKTGEILF